MAKRKRSHRTPQARHGNKSPKSRHDRRKRLGVRNSNRRKTRVARVPLVGSIETLAKQMSNFLDARIAFRLPIVLAGAMLAGSRRTASRWFRAAGVADDWDRFYDTLVSIGKSTGPLVFPLLSAIVSRFDPGLGKYWTLALDDSPTKRFGRHVEAANVHHHPTPGPADGPWLFGHNWVCLAIIMSHSLWGAVALPILSKLYVRRVDVPKLQKRYDWEFRTKHQLALELVLEVIRRLKALGSKAGFRVVVDGAYAVRSFLRALLAEDVTVISRLRRDAKLFDLPPPRTGQRGRPRIYGENRIHLAKRAGHKGGWQSLTFTCRGHEVTRRYKTFLATSKLVGGAIRVVLLEHESGNWAAYFSTDVDMDVKTLLETGANRWAIEEQFHDVKEVWGAGQQQVRNVWSNIGCWHLNSWLYTMVELASWDVPAEELVDRTDRSWDNPSRRPSHADRRRRIMRQMLEKEFVTPLPAGSEAQKYQARIAELLRIAV